MGLFDGKKGLILGVANDRSLAWAIAEFVMNQGAVCGFSHLPDRPDDEKKKNRLRVSKCTDKYPDKATILGPMDVQKDDDIKRDHGRPPRRSSARSTSSSTPSPTPSSTT